MRVLLLTGLIVFWFGYSAVAETINEKYSYKAFSYHNLSFKSVPASEFNNTVIVGSCFSQECIKDNPPVDMFPSIKGVTFRKCNLDNVFIPNDNVVEENCSYRLIKVQNDLSDWVLNSSLEPIEPTDKEMRIDKGISIKPEDIPSTKQEKTVYDKLEEVQQ